MEKRVYRIMGILGLIEELKDLGFLLTGTGREPLRADIYHRGERHGHITCPPGSEPYPWRLHVKGRRLREAIEEATAGRYVSE